MFKQFLKGVDGMDNYLIFSMLVFLVFFIGVAIYVITMKKETADELKQLPMADEFKHKKES